ncbi:MAG: isochorismatase, partial [Thermoleophilia bacterium]
MTPLPVPPHFDPDSVGDVWRVPYQERAREARAWAAEHGLQAAAEDEFRLCVLAVDVQNTFCIPDFELFVAGRSGTGAVDDNRRLCEFIYRNLGTITRIFPSLDTHEAMQIFH